MVAKVTPDKPVEKRPNQWVVYCRDIFNASSAREQQKIFNALEKDVQGLIDKQRGKKPAITKKYPDKGYLLVQCSDAFGRKLKQLPTSHPNTSKVHYYKKAAPQHRK